MSKIVIVGSGPSGCFLANALIKKAPHLQIDILEQLETPFGLLRYGVAPDHLVTRKQEQMLERLIQHPNIALKTSVKVGQDIDYEQLKTDYSLVVFATGASQDKPLRVSDEELMGVCGSGAFAAWYNGHPDFVDWQPNLGNNVIIIGNGNVSLDIARVLAKTPEERKDSVMPLHVQDYLAKHPVKQIRIIGRREPIDAKFTTAELAELDSLSQASPWHSAPTDFVSQLNDLPISQQKMLQQLGDYHRPQNDNKPVSIEFLFNLSLKALSGTQDKQLSHATFERTDSTNAEPTSFEVNTLIGAIGYTAQPIPGVPFDADNGIFAHTNGRIDANVYCVGWCKRGPQGVIPVNRADAMALAKTLFMDHPEVFAE
ncbi:ferredoxin--NADP reductase domain-containing protein [Nitrincola alkalisediminis]|uniref:FAD-dependent oxidoreductase n=1 Tax=Nitrincola alkalisediminis TaxID=1366656 RepID=UPI00187748DB|nr:FAD-dependent oxidoreductase [Nitrincola alkalisediminis]